MVSEFLKKLIKGDLGVQGYRDTSGSWDSEEQSPQVLKCELRSSDLCILNVGIDE